MAQRDKTWENGWKSILESKSITPPEEVWNNITEELDKPRRRYLQPIWWAAATISIIAVAAILLTESIPSDQQGTEPFKVELGEINEEGPLADIMVPENPAVKNKIPVNDSKLLDNNKNAAAALLKEEKQDPEDIGYPYLKDNPSANIVVYDFIPGLIEGMKAVVADLKLPEIGEIWGVPMVYNMKRETAKSNWYAGLDLSTGSASGNSDGSVSADHLAPLQNSTLSKSQADNSSSSITSSTSYGITVGKKVTKKIILETGISYSRLSGTATTNIAMASASGREAFNYNASTIDASLTTTSPYNVEHLHQFISIPVKAGYLVLDRQWKIALNAGVAGDYFLKTHTADLSGHLRTYEANPATDPQWNSMSMSVLGEVNLSRQFGRNYIIAVTPQMRHSVNDFSNTSSELRPSIFQVGIQLKYQFD